MTTTAPTTHRGRTTSLAMLLTALLAVPLTGSVAHAADNGAWAVYPTPARNSAPGSRTYFTLDASPGDVIKEHVTIANNSDRAMTFTVYGADAYNTPRDGGFALRGNEEHQTDIGAWTKAGTSKVTVRAHGRSNLPFTLTIPANATPGDHSGALVAMDNAIEGTQQRGAASVGIRRAVGARIYLHVKGPVRPHLGIDNVHIDHRTPVVPFTGSNRATVHYTLVNRGNTRLQPRLELTATDLFGRTTFHTSRRTLPLTLLPGQRVDLTAPWQDAPQLGRETLTLHVTASGGAQATAHATITSAPWLLLTLLLILVTAVFSLPRVRRRLRARIHRALLGRRSHMPADRPQL